MFKANIRTTLAVLHDAVAAVLAWSLAYLLRFNFELPSNFAAELQQTLYWVVPLQLVIFWRFNLYRGIWRYASTADLRRIVLAVMLSAAAIPLMFWMLRLNLVIPRSVLVINPLLLILMMGGSRFVYRLWKEQGLYGNFKLRGEPVLVLGAGDAAANLAKDLVASSAWRLVGFLDDDTDKHGRMLNGIRVLGKLDSLSEWARRLGVSQVIIAMPSSSHQQRKRAILLCNAAQVKALTVPSFDDLISGKVSVSQLRAVELDDLLGRDPVVLDDAGLHGLLTGKAVMVTGAGGSIGSEMCRQIARFSPSRLVLFESCEFALYTIEQELTQTMPALNTVCLIGDVRDAARMDEVMQTAPAERAVSRCGLQARAADGAAQCLAGDTQQRAGHLDGGARSPAKWCRQVRDDLHRQGHQPDQCDGSQQTLGRNGLPGIAISLTPNTSPKGRGWYSLRDGAFRQCAGQHRQRDSHIPRANRAGRANHGDASRNHALLHVHSGGGAIGIAGRD